MEFVIMNISLFVGLPLIVFGYLLVSKKYKRDVEVLKAKKEMLELEVRNNEARAKLIEEENKRLDQLIFKS